MNIDWSKASEEYGVYLRFINPENSESDGFYKDEGEIYRNAEDDFWIKKAMQGEVYVYTRPVTTLDIDWDKAPKGYDFHIQWANMEGDFYCDVGDRYIREDGYYAKKEVLVDMPEIIVTRRPAEPTWSGPQDGLPPIGTVCEVRDDLENIREVEIIAHTKRCGAPVAVYQCDEEIGAYTASLFHPIKTPEQIAAEEREAYINRMVEVLHTRMGHGSPYSVCEALYNEGLRFPEDK